MGNLENSNLYNDQKSWPFEDKTILPSFLKNRIDNFYEKKVKEKWGNQHIIKGAILHNAKSILINNNDYLSLGKNQELLLAQKEGILQYGNGQMMSSVFFNGENIQSFFEQKMAEFMQVEDVITYQSGYCANLGLIQTIADEKTPVYIDMMAHTSMWEGARAANAITIPFLHNTPSHLYKKIKANGPGVILVDSVYSTNGDICPLREIAKIARELGSIFVVDESHSLGLYGKNGEGLVHELGLGEDVHFITVSLAKTFCGRGGIVTCSKRTKDYIALNSYPSIFSTAVAAYDLTGFVKAIDIIKNGKKDRENLNFITKKVKSSLLEMEYFISDFQSPIIALNAGSEKNVIIIRDFLNRQNIFGAVFAPPATTEKTTCYRLTLNSSLTEDDADHIINSCRKLKAEFGDLIPDLFSAKTRKVASLYDESNYSITRN